MSMQDPVTTIHATKDNLEAALLAEFSDAPEHVWDELRSVIDDLVVMAHRARGGYTHYSDYLDAVLIVEV